MSFSVTVTLLDAFSTNQDVTVVPVNTTPPVQTVKNAKSFILIDHGPERQVRMPTLVKVSLNL